MCVGVLARVRARVCVCVCVCVCVRVGWCPECLVGVADCVSDHLAGERLVFHSRSPRR